MRKYGVCHKTALAYHPHTNGQAKISNKEIKIILEKMVNGSRKDWAKKIDDTLWAHRIAFKMLMGMSPYRLVFEKGLSPTSGARTQGLLCNQKVQYRYESSWQ